jgi:hypothetical protein
MERLSLFIYNRLNFFLKKLFIIYLFIVKYIVYVLHGSCNLTLSSFGNFFQKNISSLFVLKFTFALLKDRKSRAIQQPWMFITHNWVNDSPTFF